MSGKFYAYQVQRFGILLGWGLANTLAGIVVAAAFNRRPVWRYFGLMSAGWGVVNAVIAYLGQRGARKNAQAKPNEAAGEAAKMQRLLLINVPLDVGYVAGGIWLARHADPKKHGSGLSIIGQGVWLFLYDGLLAWEVGRRWKAKV